MGVPARAGPLASRCRLDAGAALHGLRAPRRWQALALQTSPVLPCPQSTSGDGAVPARRAPPHVRQVDKAQDTYRMVDPLLS